MKDQIRKIILEVVASLWKETGLKEGDIEINKTPEKFGDYSTNVAMKLAGIVGKSPMEIAEMIKEKLEAKKPSPALPLEKGEGKKDISNISVAQSLIEKTEVAKPGFINFYLSQEAYKKTLLEIKNQGDQYGFSDLGKGKTVMVEFGQPNTHKAFHIGHLKSAISGLSVTRMFEALGYQVIKVNYYGDIGMHVAKTTWAVKKEGFPENFEAKDVHQKMKFIDDMYAKGSQEFKNNPEAEKEIREINTNIYVQKKDENFALYEKLRDYSLEQVKEVFESLGVVYDRQYPESEVYKQAVEIVKNNVGKIFEESQGAIIYNGEKDNLTTWVFLTKEGNPTYSAKDLALANKKFSEYDLDLAVVTTSVEQTDYFKVIIHCLELLRPELKGKYKHIPFGWLLRDNKKTSSRMGDTIKGMDIIKEAKEVALKELGENSRYDENIQNEIVDKVALAGLKFLILSHEFHNNINYNPENFIKLKGFSGPFILYSYVRVQAVVRKIEEIDLENLTDLILQEREEKQLASALTMYKDVVLKAGQEITPHIICNYLYEVAQKFNSFYENCPIQKAENEIQKKSRLALAVGTGQVLKNGLGLLGIDVLERM